MGFPTLFLPIARSCPELLCNGRNRCIVSVVGDAHLISEVYFPRLILPLAGTVSGIVDFSISFRLLEGMMAWYGITVTWRILAVPPLSTLRPVYCIRRRALAVRSQCSLSERRLHRSISHPDMDVSLAYCLPGKHDPGEVSPMGQVIEARIMRTETADLSLSQTTIR